VATFRTQFDSSQPAFGANRDAVLAGVRQALAELLDELGSPAAAEMDRPPERFEALNIERELGLGSLERVELLTRLERLFNARLPDRVMAEADTVGDVVAAMHERLRAPAAEPAASPGAERRGESHYAPTHEQSEQPAAGLAPAETKRPAAAPWPALERARGLPPLRPVEQAETLVEVLFTRGRDPATATRPHIFLYDDAAFDAPAEGSGALPEPETVTNAELLARAIAVAERLIARGIAPGDRVALMLPTGRGFFAAFAGTMVAGAVPVPIYPPFRADRLEEYAARQAGILRSAGAKLLITFGRVAPLARLMKPRVGSLVAVVDITELDAGPAAAGAGEALAELPRVRPEDLAFLQYTSGSTGEPKGVMLTHANLLANIRAITRAVEVRADDVAVSWLPLYHDMGLIGTWMTPLALGIPVAILSPLAFLSRPERWLRAIERHRGTLSAAPNFAYELCARRIAEEDLEGLDLSSWRAALNGAEPVNAETLERFVRRFARYGLRREALLPVYGLAEATLALTIPPPGRGPLVDRILREPFEREGRAAPAAAADQAAAGNGRQQAIAFVSSGRVIPGHEIELRDDAGRAVGERQVGRLWFRGPSATQGYFRNAEATRALRTPDGWVDSGDHAYRVGEEYFITGRAKDLIIKAGRNIVPQEVEEMAGEVEGIRRGCVVAFGAPDPTSGTERLIVVAETRAEGRDGRAALAARVGEHIARELGIPPDRVELIPPGAIPKTSSGKLRRSETRRLWLEGSLGAGRRPLWLQVARMATAGAAARTGRTLRRIGEKLYAAYVLALFAVWIVPAWTVMKLLPSRASAIRWTSASSRWFFRLAGIRIRVSGREHLEGIEGCIFVSNHTSFLDVLVIMAMFPAPFRFVSKMEVHGYPFIGGFLRKRDDFAFDRSSREARLAQVAAVEESLRRGESVWVFPEGTYTPHDGVRPFQLGAFKAAVATGRPIVPVGLCGVRSILRDETVLPRPGRVSVTILPPIYPEKRPGRDWAEIIRLRDAARTALAPSTGEPLL
jgi:fatty-acyl-CoA synthase